MLTRKMSFEILLPLMMFAMDESMKLVEMILIKQN